MFLLAHNIWRFKYLFNLHPSTRSSHEDNHSHFLAFLISTISACSLIPRVIINSFDIVGRVVDNDTNEPIRGVRVTARTEFGNASGARSVLQGDAYTNAQGEFDIPQNPIDISSYQKYIMPNASLDFEKKDMAY